MKKKKRKDLITRRTLSFEGVLFFLQKKILSKKSVCKSGRCHVTAHLFSSSTESQHHSTARHTAHESLSGEILGGNAEFDDTQRAMHKSPAEFRNSRSSRCDETCARLFHAYVRESFVS
jgi:hypothetical protein